MYATILKEHRLKSSQTRKSLDVLRASALTSCELVTQHLYNDVQSGVAQIYRNQKAIQQETQLLHTHTQKFTRTTERWLQLSSQLNNSLKELGDITNWALTIQKDMRWIEQNLSDVVEENNMKRVQIHEKRQQERERRVEEEKQRREEAAQQQRMRSSNQQSSTTQQSSASNLQPPTHYTRERAPSSISDISFVPEHDHDDPVSISSVEHVDGEDEELP